jgi:hypothetical protein
VTARQVRREVVGIVVTQPAEVDDPLHAGTLGGDPGVLGTDPVGLFEVARVAHRMDQEVDGLNSNQRGIERRSIQHVGDRNVHVGAPLDPG